MTFFCVLPYNLCLWFHFISEVPINFRLQDIYFSKNAYFYDHTKRNLEEEPVRILISCVCGRVWSFTVKYTGFPLNSRFIRL